ncbi:MAG TPA: hypothetical protein VNQ76_08980, partial [Planctomicrobium sp.]|nr:hypothetical protein [Planctomicrobium sp.]
ASPQPPATPAVPAETPKKNPTASNPNPPASYHDQDVESEPSPDSQNKARWRVDNQHTAPSGPVPGRQDRPRRSQRLEKVLGDVNQSSNEDAETEIPEAPVVKVQKAKRKARIDASHAEDTHAPHFDTRVNAPRKSSLPGRMEAMWGQLMAYLGVGLLTVGTVFVLWGYFGDIERYASTGWLVATAGQMLLLLGIVTLVGGGMQQTTHEVSQRIEHLGGRIIRIEQSTDKILKGPHFRRSKRGSQKGVSREQDAA